MKGTIHSGEKRRREGCPEEAAFLELLLTTDMLSRRLVKVLKAEDSRRRSTTCCESCAAHPQGSRVAKSPAA